MQEKTNSYNDQKTTYIGSFFRQNLLMQLFTHVYSIYRFGKIISKLLDKTSKMC